MKIVVRGTNWIGDTIMTIPALKKLRRIFPSSHISLHTRAWAAGVFQEANYIDEILSFEDELNVLKSIRIQSKIWRKESFDLALLFTNSFQTALLSKLGKVKKSFGYKNEGRGFLLTNPIKKPSWKGNRHEIYYYLNLVSEIEKYYFHKTSKIQNVEIYPELKVSDERKNNARRILLKHEVDLTKATVGLGVGSANSRAKRWPTDHYARLNDLLQKSSGINVVLMGSKKELDISREVYEKATNKPVILTGKTKLADAVSILSELVLFVSNDMGLAHIASAVGTKTLVIFGPTNPLTTAPQGAEIISKKDVECAPCMLRNCSIDHPCMIGISAEEVFERTEKILFTE